MVVRAKCQGRQGIGGTSDDVMSPRVKMIATTRDGQGAMEMLMPGAAPERWDYQ